MKKNLIGECIAEFIGCGSVASLVLNCEDISQLILIKT